MNLPAVDRARYQPYDVMVAGGGMAGIAAALASARSGARTVLVEQAGWLGGMGHEGMGGPGHGAGKGAGMGKGMGKGAGGGHLLARILDFAGEHANPTTRRTGRSIRSSPIKAAWVHVN